MRDDNPKLVALPVLRFARIEDVPDELLSGRARQPWSVGFEEWGSREPTVTEDEREPLDPDDGPLPDWDDAFDWGRGPDWGPGDDRSDDRDPERSPEWSPL